MLQKNVIEQGGFRALGIEELGMVTGGIGVITVTGESMMADPSIRESLTGGSGAAALATMAFAQWGQTGETAPGDITVTGERGDDELVDKFIQSIIDFFVSQVGDRLLNEIFPPDEEDTTKSIHEIIVEAEKAIAEKFDRSEITHGENRDGKLYWFASDGTWFTDNSGNEVPDSHWKIGADGRLYLDNGSGFGFQPFN